MTAPDCRIPPLPFAEWSEEARKVLPRYLRRPELYESEGGDRPMPASLGHYAHHIRLGEGWLNFSDVLAKDPLLDPRHREILILRVAWRTRSGYEWFQHVRIAQQYGLTPEHVQAAMEGPDAALWTPVERALVAATDEMIDRSVVSDRTWGQLRPHFDDKQLIELLYVVGAYLCLALVFNSVGLPPDPTPEVDVPLIPPLDV
jgi:4-carboxymuconolactone decarboxylase